MLRIKPLLVLCAALLTVTPAASADVNSDMNQFFNKLGFASIPHNRASGRAGRRVCLWWLLYARTQVKNIQLISMTLPDINAGCGGIDAYLGSFSFINGDQLQRFVKQIMSNAAGYFLTLPCRQRCRKSKPQKTSCRKWQATLTV